MNYLILIAILAAGGDAFAAVFPADIDAGYLRSQGISYVGKLVKVILREGASKLAVRGELEMYQQGGRPAIEGKKQYDPALLQPANNAYKNQLDAVWASIRMLRKW